MSLDMLPTANPNPVIETEASIIAQQKRKSSARRRNIWLLRLAIVVV